MGDGDSQMSLRISVLQDKKFAWYRGDSVRYLVVEVEAPPGAESKVKSAGPLTVVFDASAAAEPSAIRAGEAIISELLDHLPTRDHMSIVAYSRRGDGMAQGAESRWGTAAPTVEVRAGLGLFDAWLFGAELTARAMDGSKLPCGRIILMQTASDRDARANVSELGHIARGLEKRGIATTAIGVGSRVDLSCLIAIDDTHGQQQLYAETPTEIAQILATNVLDIYPIVATEVTILLKASPRVAVSAIDHFDSAELGGASVSVGDLRAGAKKSAIFKLRLPPGDIGQRAEIGVEPSWRSPNDNRKGDSSQTVSFEFARGRVNSPQPVDGRAALLTSQAWRNAILWQAYQLMNEGLGEEADRVISTETLYLERYCRTQYLLKNQLALLADGLRTLGAA